MTDPPTCSSPASSDRRLWAASGPPSSATRTAASPCTPANTGLPIDDTIAPRFEGLAGRVGTEVVVGLRPEAFADVALDPALPGERTIEAVVDLVESLGADVLIHVAVGGVRMVARLTPRSRLNRGDVAKLAVDLDAMHLFDPGTGATLRRATAG